MASFSWPMATLLVALITVAAGGLWWLATRFHDHLDVKVRKAPWTPRPPLRIANLSLFGTGWIRGLLHVANNVAAFLLKALLAAMWLLLVVLVLPIWEQVPARAWSFVAATVRALWRGFVDYLPNLGQIIVTIAVVVVILKVLRWLFEEVRRGRIRLGRFDPTWARQTYGLVRFAAVALTAIMIFPLLPGSGTTGFQGIAIFVGALVSIGASTAVGNAVAGIVLTYTKAIQRGERVRINETTGDVIARTMFVTRLRTIRNEDIAIPNQLVLAGPIINYSRDSGGSGVAVEVRIGLGYDVPWRRAHELLKEATAIEGVRQEPGPTVFQEALGDFAVAYTLHAFIHDPKTMVQTRSRIMERIMDLFSEANIEIVSPDHVAVRNTGPVGATSAHLQT